MVITVLSVFVVIFAAQIIFKGKIYPTVAVVFGLAILAIISREIYLLFTQYWLWQAADLTSFLLPPHRSLTYLGGYVFFRSGVYYLVSLLVAVSFIGACRHLNKKFGYLFFEPEEPYLGALVILLLGNLVFWGGFGWLVYLITFLSLYVLWHFFKKISSSTNGSRLSPYYLWLPAGILVILTRGLI